jgi:hypothetical protein
MQAGIDGVGCCDVPDAVWGVSSNAPHFLELIDAGDGVLFPYDLRGNNGYLDVLPDYPGNKEIVPIVVPRQVDGVFPFFAARVPSSYPYAYCEDHPPMSSADPEAEEQWKVELSELWRHKDEEAPTPDVVPGWGLAFSSRAIYVDGKQSYVNYRIYPKQEDGDYSLSAYEIQPWAVHGTHAIIDIDKEERIALYPVEYFNFPTSPTLMESMYSSFVPSNTLNTAGLERLEPANDQYFGLEYYVGSEYDPSKPIESHTWKVFRVKYEGTRLGSPGIEIFCTTDNHGIVGDPAIPYSNDHIIMLPAVRAYIDTSLPEPDECWVCAKTIEGDPELVVGRWLQKVYRTGVGSEDEETGAADGTLTPGEIEKTILPTTQTDEDFPSENWADLRVWCYNRIWDYISNEPKDLLLFTSSGEITIEEPVIVFEDEMDANPELDININLPEGLQFVNGGNPIGNLWIVDDSDSHSGTFSARVNDNTVTEGITSLSITVNVRTASSPISFWYRHDNRRAHALPPHDLIPVPDVENTFIFSVDGVPKLTVTNSTFTDHSDYTTWYQHTESLPAGTHTLTWKFTRVHPHTSTFQEAIGTWLDNIEFPEVLIGDDINGTKRWCYDGEKVISLENLWSWAKRDDEAGSVSLDGRGTTIPYFVTMDRKGRLLIGNPHYVLRLNQDRTLDESHGGARFDPGIDSDESGGYVRFTASPNVYNNLDPPCNDPDVPILQPDPLDDPRWGAFQILPKRDCSYQLRGVNGTYRDATNLLVPLSEFKYRYPQVDLTITELYKYNHLRSKGLWTMRPCCWTVSEDGRTLIPHLEVIWRPTKSHPAWPEGPPYAHPPYQSDFANSDQNNQWLHFRPRDHRHLSIGSEKPRWSPYSYVISRSYSDSWSQDPQYVWTRISGANPPNDPEHEDYWDPDWAPGVGYGPWSDAKWFLVQARHTPTSIVTSRGLSPVSISNLCDDPENPDVLVASAVWRLSIGGPGTVAWLNYIDFDIVDCDCNCCFEGLQPPIKVPED